MNSILTSMDKVNKSVIITEDKVVVNHEMARLINNTALKYFYDGIKPKDRVAIISENSLAYVIGIYALWRINAIPIPLNIRLTEKELTKLVDFSGCAMVLKSEKYSNYLPKYPSLLLSIEYNKQSLDYKNKTKEDDIAVILFTSGSSGKPKGVKITNSNLYESYLAITSQYFFKSEDRFLASLPFYHIGGFSVITRSILSGGTLIIPNSLKCDVVAESLRKYDPTIISLVPTMLRRLIKKRTQPNEHLRLAFIGGGPSDDELVINALKLGWPFAKVYGSTETCSMISGVAGKELKKKPASGGKAFTNIEIKIFNNLYGEAKPLEIGEITVKSKTVAKGYLKNSELWSEKLHNEYYWTGDFGYIDENGYLYVVSRRTDLIISGGENIDPTEIEKAIITHPAVSEVTIFPIPNQEWGEIPVAVIVVKNNERINEKEMNEYLINQLSSYKLPKKTYFINDLPKTDLGKIDFSTLKKNLNLD